MKTLTKKIGNETITLTHVKDNMFKIASENTSFTKGKQPASGIADNLKICDDGKTLFLTKKQMMRMRTYMVYLNNKQVLLDENWINNNGVEIVITDPAVDIYYYFRRADCGIFQSYCIGSEKIAFTNLTKKLGQNGVIAK